MFSDLILLKDFCFIVAIKDLLKRMRARFHFEFDEIIFLELFHVSIKAPILKRNFSLIPEKKSMMRFFKLNSFLKRVHKGRVDTLITIKLDSFVRTKKKT